MKKRIESLGRAQILVLAFFVSYWIIILVLLLAVRPLYDQVLQYSGNQPGAELPTFVVLTALFAILSAGVIRGWRWTFWLILAVFLVGFLRAIYAALEVAGAVQARGPRWYVVLPGAIGLIQFVIALAMLAGFRRPEGWGRRSKEPGN